MAMKIEETITIKCDFCLNDFQTKFVGKHNFICCKKCDAIASVYARFKSTEDKHEFYLKRRPVLILDCLDIDATIQKFGYDPKDLSSHSNKKIVAKCKYCDIRVEINMHKYTIREGKITCRGCFLKKSVDTMREKYGKEPRQKPEKASTEFLIEFLLKNHFKVGFIKNEDNFYVPSIDLTINFKSQNEQAIFIEKPYLYQIEQILNKYFLKSEPEIEIDSSKLKFENISKKEAHEFLSKYNVFYSPSRVEVSFGAFFKNELISVCIFGNSVRNSKLTVEGIEYENTREVKKFFIRPNITSNTKEFYIENFINSFRIHSEEVKIITSYQDLGWKLLKNTKKSYCYVNQEQIIHKHNAWVMSKKEKMEENELMIKLGNYLVEEPPKPIWYILLETKILNLDENEQKCRICHVIKPISDFYITDRKNYDGTESKTIRPECKICQNKVTREYHQKNREYSTFNNSNRTSKRLNRQTNITLEFVREIIGKPCNYCGDSKGKIGIDRFDNSIGYMMDNCVPCCIRCNVLKSDMPVEAWMSLVPNIKSTFEQGLFKDWWAESKGNKRGKRNENKPKLPDKRLRENKIK